MEDLLHLEQKELNTNFKLKHLNEFCETIYDKTKRKINY